MSNNLPLTIYFDASCRLCNCEIQAIKNLDMADHLVLVDCSAANFDDTLFLPEGITRAALMEALHVRDSQGKWIVGAASFELICRTVGLSAIANILGSRYARPVAERIYPWIVRHRQLLSRTGLHLLCAAWGRYAARRACQRSQKCSQGQCSL